MRGAKVMLPCSHEWENTKDVEFLNIEEDFEGRDVLTYRCPACGEVHKSIVVAGGY